MIHEIIIEEWKRMKEEDNIDPVIHKSNLASQSMMSDEDSDGSDAKEDNRDTSSGLKTEITETNLVKTDSEVEKKQVIQKKPGVNDIGEIYIEQMSKKEEPRVLKKIKSDLKNDENYKSILN